tara:strand:+ start:659 stop:1120 length:462 start_codon:yes stop_codon:yes gene_type:complete
MNHKILNTREAKKIRDALENQFGYTKKLDYGFIENNKGKIFMINKDLGKIDFKELRINKWGLYLGTMQDDGIRLSLEGAHFIAQHAKKNIIELSDDELHEYFTGNDIEKELDVGGNPFLILKHKDDILGCAKYKGKIFNYLPKIHRTNDLIVE